MEDKILVLEKDFSGNFSIPPENCIRSNGVLLYRKPLLVNQQDWGESIGICASIVSKANKNNKCLVFATSIDYDNIINIKRIFWAEKWDEKECSILYGSDYQFSLPSVFHIPDDSESL